MQRESLVTTKHQRLLAWVLGRDGGGVGHGQNRKIKMDSAMGGS